jgi:hypothetical protein
MKDGHSNGIDRLFPFGPTCLLDGIEVPAFVTCSKNGSITSQLVTNMLQRMDYLKLFNRTNGINPFLLYDGHVIRGAVLVVHFGVQSTIVVLYRGTIWYIIVSSGQSVKQNGAFKIESKKAESDTVTSKTRSGLPVTLELSDIVRILNIALAKFVCSRRDKQ